MRVFEFPLRKALEWRRTQVDIEEAKLLELIAESRKLELAMVRLDLEKTRTEQSVRQSAAVEASDLWALAAYRARLMAELQALSHRRREREEQVDAQRQRVLEAERQYRLLEKLQQRRLAEWQMEADHETENLASESFLARWKQR